MAWFVNRALTNFRNAVNAKYPWRDKASDGTIGDAAHQGTSSDHNPDPDGSVDAWDMDVEVNGPGRPYAADVEALKKVFQAHESSQYWIHNGQIASRSTGPWARRAYTGSNRHDKHVHWNTRQSRETSNAPWVLDPSQQGDDMTPEQDRMLYNLDRLNTALLAGAGTVTAIRLGDGSLIDLPLKIAQDVTELRERPAVTVDLSAVDLSALGPVIEAAVRKVLTEGVGP